MEDGANDSGEAIDTFSGYAPSALPPCLMNTLQRERMNLTNVSSKETNHKTIRSMDTPTTAHADVVIAIDVSSDEEHSDNKDDTNDELFSPTLFQSIPSHISPACESALLASVAAPRASNESAQCLMSSCKTKALSPLQLEGACLAISRHNRLLMKYDENDSVTTNTNHSISPPTRATSIRAGFFVGDAAGIGKGRTIAGVLLDSLCRGRMRHLWVSVSRELALDAARDLKDLDCHVVVHDGSDLLNQTSTSTSNNSSGLKGLGAGGEVGKGILFVTYSLLVSGQGRRMEEIIKWLSGGSSPGTGASKAKHIDRNSNLSKTQEQAYDGVIVFDEAHKAKNLDADTHTSKLVLKLQERLAHARVLYCSATGVSDIKHMVYANRLGLWGAGCSTLYPTFESFQQTLSNRGMGSLEMLALEMKQMGSFVARTLSWDGAEFETMHIALDAHQVRMYDGAVQWWFTVQKEILQALLLMKMKQPPKTLWRAYWSAHQRFFREMAICAKVKNVAKEALHHLKVNNSAIVIGLQSTGEASTQAALEELGEQILLDSRSGNSNSGKQPKIDYEEILLPSLVSTARSIMTSFVQNHFPIAPPPLDVPKVPPPPTNGFVDQNSRLQYMYLEASAERIKNLPPPLPISELLLCKQSILDASKLLELPPNPLDDLIDRLGGEGQVAELTGRSGRILRYKDNIHFHYVRRIQEQSNQKAFGLSMPKSSDDFDKLNIVEKKKFMDGRKSVAIISDAASTGISLHAAAGSGAAHKRRVHFTIELPWAADKAIQQLGRTHRSGQLSAPIYKMVVTELGGERRFGAAVAKRMANLGALTKGDRRAATGSDLSEFDIDSVYGRRALTRMYQCLLVGLESEPPTTAPSRHGNVILDEFSKQALDDYSISNTSIRDDATQRAYALAVAKQALDDVGLSSNEAQKTAQVKVFLNRIAGLPVLQQKLVFSLFMSTLDDVVADAKATGEFEGGVEDVKATHIELDGKPEMLAVDKRSGARTTLTRLNLDRGISLETVVAHSLEDVAPEATKKEDVQSPVAMSGFYLSKRMIAGRQLILFARRKVEPDVETGDYVHDPLGLMIITRPNTGKNPCEMVTKDLRIKYRRILSVHEIISLLKELEEKATNTAIASGDEDTNGVQKDHANDGTKEGREEEPIEIFRRKSPQVARLWDDAYNDSNAFEHTNGLAPRRLRLGLVTGAVLHVLPALEKAVAMRRQSERALRVARVEISLTEERLVGIRFPLDKEVTDKLKTILDNLSQARKGSSEATLFTDEAFTPVCKKATVWATTERKTMRSFFTASTPTLTQGIKRKEMLSHDIIDIDTISPSPNHSKKNIVTLEKMKKVKEGIKSSKTRKKTANINSFFVKKS